MRLTGEYDYQLRVACADAAEFETVIDRLKREHGVRELTQPRFCPTRCPWAPPPTSSREPGR